MFTTYPATTFDTTISYPSTDYPAPSYTGTGATAQANGWAPFTSNGLLHRPDWSNGSGRKGILALHGNNQTAWSAFQPGAGGRWGDYTRALADYGFVVLAMDLGGLSNGNNLAMRALDLAYSYLCGITGGSTVGLLGSSDGGLAALNWLHKRPSQVKATFLVNPYIDVDSQRQTTGWVKPWSIAASDPNAGITYPTGDGGASASAYLCANDTDWQNNAVAQQHTPARYPGDYAGKRIHIAKSQLDATIPYQQDVWWVGAVNSPTVTLSIYNPTGNDHQPSTLLAGGATDSATTAAGGLPRSALRDFFYEFL